MSHERLQKFLARAGAASRRNAEQLIVDGRVRVDGKIVTELGTKVDGSLQRIELDGKRIVAERPVYLMLNKPRGVMCTLSDPEGRPTILDLLKDVAARVVSVGRLDYSTSGVLLLSNDGDFVGTLSHPSSGTEKVYVAKYGAELTEEEVQKLGAPILIDGKKTRPVATRLVKCTGGKTWVEFTLKEGRNRQIHRMSEDKGLAVQTLTRLSFAGLQTGKLKIGEYRALSGEELAGLKKSYGVPRSVPKTNQAPVASRTSGSLRNGIPRATFLSRGSRLRSEEVDEKRQQKTSGGEPRRHSGGARNSFSSGSTDGQLVPRSSKGARAAAVAEERAGGTDGGRRSRFGSTQPAAGGNRRSDRDAPRAGGLAGRTGGTGRDAGRPQQRSESGRGRDAGRPQQRSESGRGRKR